MELRCWGFFLVRLAFTQLRRVGGKGFLIHRNTAAQPSRLPRVGVSDYLSLPFMLLTVMNLFSWNGQNLGPQMGSEWPWLHCRGSFLWKRTTFLNKVCNTLGTDTWFFLVSGTYMLCVCDFGGMWKEETNPSCWRARGFPFFPCTECRDPEHGGGRLPPRWECTKAHAYCREDGWGTCWVSACSV